MLRGLFEYLYRADSLILIPHIPAEIRELQQIDPVRFGDKKIYLTVFGAGSITAVKINNIACTDFTGDQIRLSYDRLPEEAHVTIERGYTKAVPESAPVEKEVATPHGAAEMKDRSAKLQTFMDRLGVAGLQDRYEFAHADLALASIGVIARRAAMLKNHKLAPLAQPSRTAADQSYVDA